MEPQLLDTLHATLQAQGPEAAVTKLCDELKSRKEYAGLFYALLMKKRHELGVSPIATGSNQDLPPEHHQAFEDGIRDAARTVGKLWLDEGDLPQAWAYYRMLGETEPIAQALEHLELRDDQDLQPIIDIAFHQGVHPKKGFEWILKRYGICSAITTMSGGDLPFPLDVRQDCITRLVRSLHEELGERLKAEIERKQGFAPTGKSIPELIAGRDWLFADEFYHIDLSHLSAVVQMSTQLEDPEVLRLARELCQYGQKLSPRFQQVTDPPFENQYVDYEVFLSILIGDDVDKGLAHFRAKAENADPETVGTYPAEVLVNMLLRLKRPQEALEVSRKFLTKQAEGRHACPSFVELCQQTGNYLALAEVAKQQGNPVNFLAGLLAHRK